MSVEAVVAALASLADRATGDRPALAGHFANVMDIGGARIALAADGVGTKHLLATGPGDFRGIAIDCVAMNSNDLVCVGARPVAILDYLAVETADGVEPYAEAIAAGFRDAEAEGAGAVVGGEVAVLPGVIAPRDDGVPGLDLAATAVGVVEGDVLDGTAVAPGDVVIAVASSGPHSNGYTALRRHVAAAGIDLDATAPWGGTGTARDHLLAPTLLYPRLVEAAARTGALHAAANVTGGGLTNLCRVLHGAGMVLDRWAEADGVFDWLLGRCEPEVAYETWNMGVGFVLVVERDSVDTVLDAVPDGYAAWSAGRVDAGLHAGTLVLELPGATLVADRKAVRRA